MLRRLFVLAICMSFAEDIMAANFAGREFDYYDFSSPTTGYALWNQVIDSFKSDEFINSARSENEWEESGWKTTFESFISTSLESNLFAVWWGIPKRTAAGKKAKKVLNYLINDTSLESNPFNTYLKKSKRTSICSKSKSKKILKYLIKQENIEKTIIEKLKGIMKRSKDCSECWSEDWDGVS